LRPENNGNVGVLDELSNSVLVLSGMRTPTPPLAPDAQPHDGTVYIVLNDFGQLGRAYVETDEAAADEQTVVNNISSGEYSNPIRVVAFNTAEGWSHDVTEDIARALLDREAREADLSESARTFVQRVLDIVVH
jgi:hypothetical protein